MSSSFDKMRLLLAQRIRERRAFLNLTQEMLAEVAGLSPRHYQKLEAGELNLTLSTMCKVADALHCEIRDFMQ